jgi:hypothetical protein
MSEISQLSPNEKAALMPGFLSLRGRMCEPVHLGRHQLRYNPNEITPFDR